MSPDQKTGFSGSLPERLPGVITVFFALLSLVFLTVFSVILESARVRAARAQIANAADVSAFSVFGEFEKKLLQDFEVFAVDGAYGSGSFSLEKVNDRYKKYLRANTSVPEEGLAGLCSDPWRISLKDSEITAFALLSDQGGEYFYQQAVSYMKETAITGALEKLMSYYRDSESVKEKQEQYEQSQSSSDSQMQQLEQAKAEREKELKEAGEDIEPWIWEIQNPLPALWRLKHKPLLSIVCGNHPVSEKSVTMGSFLSKRLFLRQGDMKLPQEHRGLVSDLLYREYLLDRFPNFCNPQTKTGSGSKAGSSGSSAAGSEKAGVSAAGTASSEPSSKKLDYQVEYIIAGKKKDSSNLLSVARRLLLLREGCNYAYCLADEVMQMQASALAWVIIGWTGMPALVEILKHGLLLGWSYAESLLDVRILFDGGKVPLMKTEATWNLGLGDLAWINEILAGGGRGHKEGIRYKDYLRILLCMESISVQKMRGLDLAELNIRSVPGLSNFRADNCLIAIQTDTTWEIEPMFGRISQAFSGIMTPSLSMQLQGGFGYDAFW